MIKMSKIKIYSFSSSWCRPCVQMKPYILELKEMYPLSIRIIDIEENKELSVKYEIRSIPTLVVVEKDEHGETEIARLSGNPGKAKLFEFIKQHLDGK